jgi:hypothetical protein
VGGKRFQANAARSGRWIVAHQVLVEMARSPTDEVRELIGELEAVLSAEYPPEQRHGLKLEAIFEPHIRFFLARLNGHAIGCGGVALFADFAEPEAISAMTPLISAT